jgi:CheY-like chemotaxis protein
LAIVERLGALLDHPITLDSIVGRGSRFSVSVPMGQQVPRQLAARADGATLADPLRGRLVVVIDDDLLVLEGMRGLLEQWGCRVRTAQSAQEVLEGMDGAAPDLIICDGHLEDGETGIAALARLRGKLGANIPAFLISGDISPERLNEAKASGHHLLHKPVTPMALRSMMMRLVRAQKVS